MDDEGEAMIHPGRNGARRMAAACALAAALLVATEPAPAAGKLNVLNWSDYFIGPQAVAEFGKAQDIDITYGILDSDDTLQAKLLSGHSGYDVVYPSSTYFAKQLEAGVYQPLDWSKIPNRVNLDPALMQRIAAQDPGNRYGVPYLWGTDGMIVNVTRVRKLLGKDVPLDSWDLLFKPELVSKLQACGVSIVDQASDVLPIVLAYLGRDPNSRKLEDYREAFALLRSVRPYIDQFSTTYLNDVAGGDICIAFGWSGDAGIIKRRAREARQKFEIRYYAPRGKTGLWFVMMGIPKDAPNKENAYKWINHMIDVNIAAQITNTITYPTAVAAARSMIRPELLEDPAVFPSTQDEKDFFVYAPIEPSILRAIARMWLELKTGR